MAWQWHRRWTWSFLYWRWRWCQQEQFFENNRRFDASRWGGGSDGHLYDFVKRGFQPSRWASGSDGHLYDFAKRLARKIQRKIQIQSKKTKWPLARLDLSTIFSRVLFEHADGNDESPCWLKMRISFQPWRFCSKVPLSDTLAFLITLAKKVWRIKVGGRLGWTPLWFCQKVQKSLKVLCLFHCCRRTIRDQNASGWNSSFDYKMFWLQHANLPTPFKLDYIWQKEIVLW